MRQTPVDDYLEEISTELPEELYGNLSDAIYETVCEFDEEVAQLKADNAKLRELCGFMLRCMKRNHHCDCCLVNGEYCEISYIESDARELGIEVDG